MLSTPCFAAQRARLSAVFQVGICALLLLVLGSCESGPTAADLGRTTDTAGEIVLFSDGQQMSLISESMLEQLGVPGETPDERTMNFYSQERSSATVKVAPNDAVTGFLQYLSESGFDGWAAPGIYEGPASSSIVVKIDEDVRSMPQPTGAMADPDQLTQYVEFITMFTNVYNAIEGRQNVEGNVRFHKPVLSEKLRKEVGGNIGLGGSR